MMDRLQPSDPVGGDKPGDFEKVVTSVKEHPLRYVAGFFLIIAAGLGFLFYSTGVEARNEEAATKLVRAVNADEPAERVAMLDALVQESTNLTAEALYLKAENAFAIDDFDTARAGFEQLLAEYPNFQFTPAALEGLGYIEEAQGDYEEAIVHYLDVQVRYPGTYAARRQHYNLGRAYAAQGMIEEAVESFRRQVGEFPDSVIAGRAQHELHEYQGSHPELFQQFEEVFTSPADDPQDMELVTVPDEADEPAQTPQEAPQTSQEAPAQTDPVEEQQ